MVVRMQIERLLSLGKRSLVVAIDETREDLWLWEHAQRVTHLGQAIGAIPELRAETPDALALQAAALFHDAGWITEYQQGRWKRWQLLGRPTNDIQRELGAALLQEEAGALLPASSARRAGDAIRQCNNRKTELLEARILAEAEALDEMGSMYLLRQFRQYQAEGRPLQQLVDTWQRQKEYRFWELRLQDGFYWDTTRALARQRLAAIETFMTALARDLHGQDVRQALTRLGAAVTSD